MTNREIDLLAAGLAESLIEYKENYLLAPHTSFKIGGAARLAVFPTSRDEAIRAMRLVGDAGVKYFLLGNGTNVLVSDGGFDGAVVFMTGLKSYDDAGDGRFRVDAGVALTGIAKIAQRRSYAGLEFAYGIPGTVGGGIYMNAGAYGGELSQVVTSSDWYDTETGETGTYSGSEQDFAYRHSAYMGSSKLILSAKLKLAHGNLDEISARMDDLLYRRRDKQPLELPSAGSVFKRGDGFITAALIEQAGLKGRQIGGARVSDKHAGFIVNVGGATAEDVRRLIEEVQSEILRQFGKVIECEIRMI